MGRGEAPRGRQSVVFVRKGQAWRVCGSPAPNVSCFPVSDTPGRSRERAHSEIITAPHEQKSKAPKWALRDVRVSRLSVCVSDPFLYYENQYHTQYNLHMEIGKWIFKDR